MSIRQCLTNMVASHSAGDAATPMSFTITTVPGVRTESHAKRSCFEREHSRHSLTFGIFLSQCHMLSQWRRNVLVFAGMGVTFSSLAINFQRMRIPFERFAGELISIGFSWFERATE